MRMPRICKRKCKEFLIAEDGTGDVYARECTITAQQTSSVAASPAQAGGARNGGRFSNTRPEAKAARLAPGRQSDEIKTVQVHDLRPRADEVGDEFFLGVCARINLGKRAQLRVRAKDEIDARGGPFDRARFAIASFE